MHPPVQAAFFSAPGRVALNLSPLWVHGPSTFWALIELSVVSEMLWDRLIKVIKPPAKRDENARRPDRIDHGVLDQESPETPVELIPFGNHLAQVTYLSDNRLDFFPKLMNVQFEEHLVAGLSGNTCGEEGAGVIKPYGFWKP